MVENIPLHTPGGVGLVVATIVAALIVLGFCAALDRHYRRQRQRDLHWYADRISTLQRERRAGLSLADTKPLPRIVDRRADETDVIAAARRRAPTTRQPSR